MVKSTRDQSCLMWSLRGHIKKFLKFDKRLSFPSLQTVAIFVKSSGSISGRQDKIMFARIIY